VSKLLTAALLMRLGQTERIDLDAVRYLCGWRGDAAPPRRASRWCATIAMSFCTRIETLADAIGVFAPLIVAPPARYSYSSMVTT
jgi:hypothetical protein